MGQYPPRPHNDAEWELLLEYGPWSMNFDLMDKSGRVVVSPSDGAYSFVVDLAKHQADSLQAEMLDHARLVPCD